MNINITEKRKNNPLEIICYLIFKNTQKWSSSIEYALEWPLLESTSHWSHRGLLPPLNLLFVSMGGWGCWEGRWLTSMGPLTGPPITESLPSIRGSLSNIHSSSHWLFFVTIAINPSFVFYLFFNEVISQMWPHLAILICKFCSLSFV